MVSSWKATCSAKVQGTLLPKRRKGERIFSITLSPWLLISCFIWYIGSFMEFSFAFIFIFSWDHSCYYCFTISFYLDLPIWLLIFCCIISFCLLPLPFEFNFTILEEHYIGYLSLPNKWFRSIMNWNNIYYLFLDVVWHHWARCFRVSPGPQSGVSWRCGRPPRLD